MWSLKWSLIEVMAVKKQVYAELEEIVKPECLFLQTPPGCPLQKWLP